MVHQKQNDPTTYAGYTKLSRGRSRSDVQEWGFTVMNIEGGNSTDDSIEYRELVTANQGEQIQYEHRTEKHFEARDPPSLRALYPDKLFPSPAAWDDANNYLGA